MTFVVSDLLEYYSYRKNINNTSIAIDKLSAKEADSIIADCDDLIDNKKYKPFFYKKLYQIGKTRFIEQAEKARRYNRQGAGRLFVHLIT